MRMVITLGGEYIDGLLNYCKSNNVPIDFLSWHYYGNTTSDPQNILDIGDMIQNTLNKYGYNNIESLCTEWNSSPFGNVNTYSKVQSYKTAAYITSTFIYMQYTKVDLAHYYRVMHLLLVFLMMSPAFALMQDRHFHYIQKCLRHLILLTGDKDF